MTNPEPFPKKRNTILDAYEEAVRRTRQTLIKVRRIMIKDRIRKQHRDAARVLS